METRNVLLAIILSTIVLVSWGTFFAPVPTEKEALEEQISKNKDSSTPSIEGTVDKTEISRSSAIKKSKRIKLENENVKGSISLQGAVIDDMIFKNYKEKLNSENNVTFLNPKGSSKEYFIETGWASSGDQQIKLPSDKSIWKIKGNETLSIVTNVLHVVFWIRIKFICIFS